MFIPCMVQLPRMKTSAASLAEPDIAETGTERSNASPPYDRVLRAPVIVGQFEAVMYDG